MAKRPDTSALFRGALNRSTTPMAAQALAASPQPLLAQPAVQAVAQPVAAAPAVHTEVVKHKTVVHHPHPQHIQQAQAQSGQPYSQPAAYQQPVSVYQQPAAPVAQNSPVGIGVGAVVGGLLGNQVGGGRGKTLATIAGAVGGGFLGNEIAKRNP